jgi:hypothetical protein
LTFNNNRAWRGELTVIDFARERNVFSVVRVGFLIWRLIGDDIFIGVLFFSLSFLTVLSFIGDGIFIGVLLFSFPVLTAMPPFTTGAVVSTQFPGPGNSAIFLHCRKDGKCWKFGTIPPPLVTLPRCREIDWPTAPFLHLGVAQMLRCSDFQLFNRATFHFGVAEMKSCSDFQLFNFVPG